MNDAQAFNTITRHKAGTSEFEKMLWWIGIGIFSGFVWGFVVGVIFF